uniref:Uncharacterized protein n=1 Tax=Arundo donax TaxID=35708 RepID=A0A0A9CDB9_ARUDO
MNPRGIKLSIIGSGKQQKSSVRLHLQHTSQQETKEQVRTRKNTGCTLNGKCKQPMTDPLTNLRSRQIESCRTHRPAT